VRWPAMNVAFTNGNEVGGMHHQYIRLNRIASRH
jgi:hypothetical protein